MTINQEIKERIFTAADELYAASKDGEYPRIEDVRQLSRAGMNTVAEVMKEWRQLQRKQIQTIREPIPADLQVVLQEMGQSLWATALQLVNNSLEAARATFEAERTDLIELSEQLSEAFDKQAVRAGNKTTRRASGRWFDVATSGITGSGGDSRYPGYSFKMCDYLHALGIFSKCAMPGYSGFKSHPDDAQGVSGTSPPCRRCKITGIEYRFAGQRARDGLQGRFEQVEQIVTAGRGQGFVI